MTDERRGPDLRDTEQAVRRWADTVWRVARARLRNDADAADAFQNTFLALCNAQPEFESLEHQKAWLLRTACNCCNQLARKRSAHPTTTLDGHDVLDPSPEPGHDLELEQMLDCLTDAQRTVVHLHYFEGYTADDIARITGDRPATVRSHLHRARKMLRIQIERDGSEPC